MTTKPMFKWALLHSFQNSCRSGQYFIEIRRESLINVCYTRSARLPGNNIHTYNIQCRRHPLMRLYPLALLQLKGASKPLVTENSACFLTPSSRGCCCRTPSGLVLCSQQGTIAQAKRTALLCLSINKKTACRVVLFQEELSAFHSCIAPWSG